MGLDVKHGWFFRNTASGDQIITGVGFSGKAFIFYNVGGLITNDGSFGDISATSLGFSDGLGGTHNASATSSDDNVGTSMTARKNTISGCVYLISPNGTTSQNAYISAVDGDSFTLKYIAQDPGAVSGITHYEVYGGTDVVNAKATYFSGISGTGIQNVTGIGFSGNLVMTHTAFTPDNLAATNAHSNIGMATSSTDQASIATRSQNAAATAITHRLLKTDRLITEHSGGGNYVKGSFSGFTADGFNINWISGNIATRPLIGALVMKISGNIKVGSFNFRSGTGNMSTSGVGFSGKHVFMLANGTSTTPAETASGHARMTIGGAVSSTERGSVWTGDQHGPTTMVGVRYANSGTCLFMGIEAATAASTVKTQECDFVAFHSDGITLNRTTNTFSGNNSGMTVLYAVVGETISAGAAVVVQDTRRGAFGGGNINAPVMHDFGHHMAAMTDNRTIFGQPKIPNQPMVNVSGQLYY